MRLCARGSLSSVPRLPGPWGNFPPLAPAALESMMGVAFGETRAARGSPGPRRKPGLSPPLELSHDGQVPASPCAPPRALRPREGHCSTGKRPHPGGRSRAPLCLGSPRYSHTSGLAGSAVRGGEQGPTSWKTEKGKEGPSFSPRRQSLPRTGQHPNTPALLDSLSTSTGPSCQADQER